jgi:hypothetical protein
MQPCANPCVLRERRDAPVRLDLRREALHDVLREQREERAGQVRRRQRQQRVRQRPRHARVQQLAEAAAGRPEQLRAPRARLTQGRRRSLAGCVPAPGLPRAPMLRGCRLAPCGR